MSLLAQLAPAWRITAFYLIILILTSLSAKLISALLSGHSSKERVRFVMLAPTLSLTTWRRRRPITRSDFRRWGLRAVWILPSLFAGYLILPALLSRTQLSWSGKAYLAVVPFWLLTEAIGLATQIMGAMMGFHVPSLHEAPWRSESLAHFWGRRWNRLYSDWFRETCFDPFNHKPILALAATFMVSSLLHEALVNIPLLAVYGTNLLGSMLLYFLLQTAGILVERKWLRRRQRARRAFLWTVVLGPVPLVLNEGTLRIFHLAGD
ncbi:MAG: MBOAT family protein [Blastocatellia bacterium]